MQRVLSAFFAPEVLGWVLLAAVGVFVFLLLRPREQDAPEEFWLALIQQHQKTGNPTQMTGNKPDTATAGGADGTAGNGSATLSRI